MPVASSSRRRANRQPSSDNIEEDNPTQQSTNLDEVDGDEDEDEQPRHTSKRVKQEKTTKKRKVELQQTEDGDGDDDDGRIDINDLHDQPLDKQDTMKLRGMAEDWSRIRKSIHQPAFNLVKDVAVAMAEVAEGDEGEKVSR